MVLRKGEKHRLDFVLVEESSLLQAVEVRGDNSREEGLTRISSEWAKNVAGPTGGVESLLKSLDGVSSNNELSSQYNVRGGNFDENLVYVNDIEVFRPFLVRSAQQDIRCIKLQIVERREVISLRIHCGNKVFGVFVSKSQLIGKATAQSLFHMQACTQQTERSRG